jgi:signal transduction histidine kinase
MAGPPVSPARVVRLVAGPVALAYALSALAVAQRSGAFTTYAGRSSLVAVLAVGAGLGLVTAGLVAFVARFPARSADLSLIAGFVWFAPFWVGWDGGPPVVRSIAMVAAGFGFPLIVHVVLAYPSGRLQSTAARALVTIVYLEAALSSLGRALFRDPFLDPNCWDNCTDNVFVVHAYPRIAGGIDAVDMWFAVAAGVALAAFCIRGLAMASTPGRRTLLLVFPAGIAFAAATVAHSVALDGTPLENPTQPVFRTIFAVRCAAVIALAVGLAWAVLRARVQRRAVTRIVTDLGEMPPPGSLEPALARAVGDPELRIAYWLPASRRYGDAHGRPVEKPVATQGRVVTSLLRDGNEVAVVAHASTAPELERELGAAVRLALENERLQAEVLAQLDDLRTSRARIVETGDVERRGLERDLHDGAQQRLLALSYDLRIARTAAETDGEIEAASLLAEAVDEAQSALVELRELAHGIYPAILTEAGLGPALETLADEARLPVEIVGSRLDRYPPLVETAAYVVVAEALDDAAQRAATYAGVSIGGDDGQLAISVKDDGFARTSAMANVADRVGALGGRLDLEVNELRAEIPCA